MSFRSHELTCFDTNALELHTPISMLAYSNLYQHIAELRFLFVDTSSTSCNHQECLLKTPSGGLQAELYAFRIYVHPMKRLQTGRGSVHILTKAIAYFWRRVDSNSGPLCPESAALSTTPGVTPSSISLIIGLYLKWFIYVRCRYSRYILMVK